MSAKEKETVESVDTIDWLGIVYEFLHNLTKIWVGILVLVILCSIGSCIYEKANYRPVYTAATTFTVNIKQEQSIYGSVTYYDNAAAAQMAQTFPYILTSSYLHRMVAADMGMPVRGVIKAEVTPNTNMLTLSVTDTDPQSAYDTLESVIRNYPSVSEPIIGKVTMNVLDETGVPAVADNPINYFKSALVGAEIGLVIGLLWAMLLFITNRTIRNKNDIRNKLGINYLGTIPKIHIKRRSKNVPKYFLLTDSAMESVLFEPFRMIKNKVEYYCNKNQQEVILVTSATAGEGKSLFSANLALSLATAGKRVVLIDCDLRHPTGRTVFDIADSVGLAEYLNGEISLSEYLSSAKVQNNHNFSNFLFLPGGKALSDGSHLLSNARMQELIAFVRTKSEFVILDSAPVGLLSDSAELAKFAESAIMIIRKDFARADFIWDALNYLSESDIQIIGGVFNDT